MSKHLESASIVLTFINMHTCMITCMLCTWMLCAIPNSHYTQYPSQAIEYNRSRAGVQVRASGQNRSWDKERVNVHSKPIPLGVPDCVKQQHRDVRIAALLKPETSTPHPPLSSAVSSRSDP